MLTVCYQHRPLLYFFTFGNKQNRHLRPFYLGFGRILCSSPDPQKQKNFTDKIKAKQSQQEEELTTKHTNRFSSTRSDKHHGGLEGKI